MARDGCVVIADRHRLFADPLVSLLRYGRLRASAAYSGAELRSVLSTGTTSACVLDRYLDHDDQADRLDAWLPQFPGTSFVVLDEARDPGCASRVRARGGGYATRTDGLDVIVSAVVPTASVAGRAPSEATTGAVRHRLTQREHDVLRWLVAGAEARCVAVEMGISYTTVRTHIQHILWKLDVHSTVAAIAHALALGIVTPADASAIHARFAQDA